MKDAIAQWVAGSKEGGKSFEFGALKNEKNLNIEKRRKKNRHQCFRDKGAKSHNGPGGRGCRTEG